MVLSIFMQYKNSIFVCMCKSRSLRSFCFFICSCNLIQWNIRWCICSCGAIRCCDTSIYGRLAKITMPSKLQDRKNHSHWLTNRSQKMCFLFLFIHAQMPSQLMIMRNKFVFVFLFFFLDWVCLLWLLVLLLILLLAEFCDHLS